MTNDQDSELRLEQSLRLMLRLDTSETFATKCRDLCKRQVYSQLGSLAILFITREMDLPCSENN